MGSRNASKQNTKPTADKLSFGKIDFLKVGSFFAVVSGLAVLISIIMVLTKGFNYGIDYAGGTEVQVHFNQHVEIASVREFMNKMGYQSAAVQSLDVLNQSGSSEYLIRLDSVEGKTDKETNELLQALNTKLTQGFTTQFLKEGASIQRVDSVGPQAGSELKRNGLLAGFYSLLVILVYIGLRFDYRFASGAVFCLFHDATVILGIFSIMGREVNLQTMAAVLTLIGYSLNDTIIIFDRVRENITIFKEQSLYWLINRSINDTLSRTLLTSGATLLAVGSLYFFAGGVIRDFAFTLGVGIFIGTYSTIYVASPIVIFLDRILAKKAISKEAVKVS